MVIDIKHLFSSAVDFHSPLYPKKCILKNDQKKKNSLSKNDWAQNMH